MVVTYLVDRTFPRTPFVPANKALRDERCEEILTLQATGLATRLRHTLREKRRSYGLSGGLDSTLALLVSAKAFDALGIGPQWNYSGNNAMFLEQRTELIRMHVR